MSQRQTPSSGSIRPARRSDAEALTSLALRSKGHWGYSPEFLAACADELSVSPQYIDSNPVFLLEEGQRILGFYGLDVYSPQEAELDFLFVDPEAIGRGLGRRLFEHARDLLSSLGTVRLRIQSDPNAEEFYLAQGAKRIGLRSSDSVSGRQLPWLVLKLDPLSS